METRRSSSFRQNSGCYREREREEREIESSGLVAGAEEDRRCRWQKT